MRDKALEASLLITITFCTNFYLILWTDFLEDEPLLRGVFISLLAVGATYSKVVLVQWIKKRIKMKKDEKSQRELRINSMDSELRRIKDQLGTLHKS